MKKAIVIGMGGLLLLSSCHTAESGLYTGATFGHVLGSAIGGIAGGPRGHDWGTLIGTVGGAAAGAAVGAAVQNASERKFEQATARRHERVLAQEQAAYDGYDESGFDPTNSGDDRITMGSTLSAAPQQGLVVRHARIADANGDGVLTRGEECQVVFEIMNMSDATVYDVCPRVEDISKNKHIVVSPNLRVESIAPRQGVRYTATIKADNRLKDGEVSIRVGVAQGNQTVSGQTRTLTVKTRK